MTQIQKNLIANYAGRIVSAVLALAFIPVYVDKLGIEAYGLAGLYGTLQTLTTLLELGFGAALIRQLALLSGQKDQGQKMRDVTRTFEIYFYATAIVLAAILALAVPFIETRWLGHASIKNMSIIIIFMGIAIIVQFPFTVYNAVLLGMQMHVPLNIVLITSDVIRYFGTTAVLIFVSPTLASFFIWQIVVGVITVLAGASLVWRYLPAGTALPRFRFDLLKEIWHFSVGVGGITIMFTLIASGDKLVLSKVLDLESLGYYVIASQVAAGISTVYYPIFQSFYPKLSQMVAVPNAVQVAQLFHTFAQLLAMVMLPCLAVIWIFGDTVLFFWSQDAHLFKEVTPILLPLTLGYVANGLWQAPFALQLAEGKTRLVLMVNVLGVLLVLPGLYVLAPALGATGVAWLWAAAFALHLVIDAPVFLLARHRTIFARWLIKDLGGPMLAAAAASAVALTIAPEEVGDPRRLAVAIASGLCVALSVAAVSPDVHGAVRTRLAGYGLARMAPSTWWLRTRESRGGEVEAAVRRPRQRR